MDMTGADRVAFVRRKFRCHEGTVDARRCPVRRTLSTLLMTRDVMKIRGSAQ